MPKRSTLLKELLRQRHSQTYATFCRQYDDAARSVDAVLVGRWPSRGQFTRWLSGDIKGLPHPDHCRVLEAMFPGYTAQELFGRGSETRGDRPGPEGFVSSDSSDGSDGSDGSVGSGVTDEPDGTATVPPLRRRQPSRPGSIPVARRAPGPMPPRQANGQGPLGEGSGGRDGREAPASYPLSEELALTTEESARFARGSRGGVDHDVLDQLGADVRQLAVDYLTRPPLTLFRPLSQLRAEVFEMLDQRQRPEVLPPLYAVAGQLCALLAHACADLGHSYAAETHTRTAWLCADLADDDSLRAYVRWVQSNVAFWDGDYRRAAQTARNGRRYATRGSTLLRLTSQEARAWAAAGERSDVEKALSVAGRARDRDGAEDQVGVFRFDAGKSAYYSSEVRLALGGRENARLARADALESLERFEAGRPEQRCPEFVAAARLDLVNAHLGLSDLDAAAGPLRTVLQLPVENRTEPIVGRVTATGNTLRTAPFTDSPLARELREEIALFRAYPARRNLSEALH